MSKYFRYCFFFFIGLTFFACNQFNKTNASQVLNSESLSKTLAANTFIINGTTFTSNNKYIYLFKDYNGSYKLIDSAIVYNSRFQFNGTIKSPEKYRVSKFKNNRKSFSFLVDNSQINLFLNSRIDFSSAYSSSKIQQDYASYTSKMNTFKDQGIALYYNLKGDFSSENINKLKKDRLKLFTNQSKYVLNFIKQHPNSSFSAMLINDNIKTYNTKTLRTLFNGLSSNIRDLESSKLIDSLILIKEQITKEPVVVASSNKVETIKIKETPKGEYRPKAYKISGENPYGQIMSLNSIPKGKVILVDFWASWCAPCRATNPTLVQLYKKYNSQGFEILSVSEDKGEVEWMNAIAIDDLTWEYHILDKNKSIAFRYGVESIPFKLLIDKNGNIASDKISGNALENKIIQLLAE